MSTQPSTPAPASITSLRSEGAAKKRTSRSSALTVSNIVKTFLIAGVGALGSQIVTTFWPILWTKLHPPPKDPYAYIIGRYKGEWNWTDPTSHSPTNTHDIVYFVSITNSQLTGHGDDYHLGSYDFTGSVYGNEITADYTNYPGEGEPAQSGQFYLSTFATNPIILTGKWDGFINGQRIIEGTVKLTKDDPIKQTTLQTMK